MSKGSDVRPFNKKKFDEEFERIFGKKKEKKKRDWVPHNTDHKDYGFL